ncbi:Uncharacterized protein APZ42_008497 [Daphnia magna]|uniref:Uncharacterized protein n=1 Tax=Daphnia magna TaxID=35525 RepID=A0A164ELT4_9CRUS|nr:Uncharacterized protein APZ42_008497 [Daphnia magna]
MYSMGSSRDVRRLVTLEVHTDLLPTAKKIFNCVIKRSASSQSGRFFANRVSPFGQSRRG